MKKINLLLIVLMYGLSATHAQNLSKSFVFDGQNRTYKIYIPSIYNSSQPVPLVLALHGLSDNAANFEGVGFNQIADTANFIAVYPNALPEPTLGSSGWNPGIDPFDSINDVGFLNALIDTVLNHYSIDTNRIYCTGFSLGGFMTYRLACEIGGRLAAVASVAGSLPAASVANCDPGRVMPVLHIHGTSDQVIPYNFATIYVVVTNLGADSTTHYWAMHNGCDFPAAHESLPNTRNDGFTFEKYSYSACSDSSEVILIKVNGMDHNWPDASNDINATQEIWNFFSRHSKTASTNTGITELTQDLTISPNPASSEISVKSGFSGKIKMVLSDLAGKRVYQNEFSNSSFTVALNHLKEGIYLLTLSNRETVATRKLVVGR